MGIEVISLFLESLPKLVLVFALYTYLIYIAFFKNGKFSTVGSLEEAGKLIILFVGFFILVISMIAGIIFISHMMFSTPLPTDWTPDMQNILLSILAFVFMPYVMKKEAEKKKRKFDLGDWFFIILILDLWVIIFSIIILIYAKFFLHSSELSTQFLGIILFLGLVFLLCFAHLKVVLTQMFRLRKRKYFDKRIWRILTFQVITSIIALVVYVLG